MRVESHSQLLGLLRLKLIQELLRGLIDQRVGGIPQVVHPYDLLGT